MAHITSPRLALVIARALAARSDPPSALEQEAAVAPRAAAPWRISPALPLLAVAMAGALVACGDADKGPAQKTGEAIDKAAQKTGEAVDKAAEKTEEGAKKATEKTGEAVEKAGETVKDSAK